MVVCGMKVILQRFNAGGRVGVGFRVFLGQLAGDLSHLRIRLFLRDSVFQASHRQEEMSLVIDLLRSEGQRNPQLA